MRHCGLVPPLNDENVQEIRYEYDSVNRRFYYRRIINMTTTSQTVLDRTSPVNLTAFSASYVTGLDGDGVTCTKRATVTMTLQAGAISRTFVCSAAPRRNQQY